MPNKLCPACGSTNADDSTFCENCGARLGQTTAPAPAASAPPQPAPAQAAASPSQSSSRIPVLLALLVLVGGGAAWAIGAPMPAFLSKVGIKTRGADSVQLAPSAQNPALADTAVATRPVVAQSNTPSVVPPSTAPQAPSKNSSPQNNQSTTRTASAGSPPPPEFPQAPAGGSGVASYPGFSLPTPPPESPAPASPNPSTNEAAAPAPAPAPPAPRAVARIAAGTTIALKSASEVCSDKAQPGMKFTAIVQQDVSGENGATIPRGTAMTFVVDKSKPATASEKAQFSIAAESVPIAGEQHPVKANIDAVTIKEKSRSLMGALVGAAAAAAAAKAAGGNTKQTIGGAVAGGAAGAVIGNQIRSGNGCIERNASIRITLSSDITT